MKHRNCNVIEQRSSTYYDVIAQISSSEIMMLLVRHQAQKLWCDWSDIKHRYYDVIGQASNTKIVMLLMKHQAQKLMMLLISHQTQKLWCFDQKSSTEIMMLCIGDNQSSAKCFVCYRTMKQRKSYWSVIKQRNKHIICVYFKYKTTTT